MGLVQGYDAMGIALSKPNLRAELEADLKKWESVIIFIYFTTVTSPNFLFSSRVCDGIRPPGDVLREQVDKYRTVFVQAMEQVCDTL
jgi:DNA topoisomerase-3